MYQDVANESTVRSALAKLVFALLLSALCVTASPLYAQANEGAAGNADVPTAALNASEASDEDEEGEGARGSSALNEPTLAPSAESGDVPVDATAATPSVATTPSGAAATTPDAAATLGETSAPEGALQAATAGDELTATAAPFTYQHDPRNNPSAMRDIIADIDAVYGFRPSPDGTLKQYADADWSDPAVVEKGRQDRLARSRRLLSAQNRRTRGRLTRGRLRSVGIAAAPFRAGAIALVLKGQGTEALPARKEGFAHD